MLSSTSDRLRFIAVDWSGAAKGDRQKIWLAEVAENRLVRLECGRSLSELTAHLADEAARDPRLIVGLDFAFSFPQWFVEELGAASIRELWGIVAERGEEWLRMCDMPFWGRPGRSRPELASHFRQTETHASGGSQPKSVFQIGGAGAVGTGSIRGMPVLLELADRGFSIWPFDEVQLPLVIEIYPRLLTGAVVKSASDSRATFLRTHYPGLTAEIAGRAGSSEDAFDAAVSALVMAQHGQRILTLDPAADRDSRLEGLIWHPGLQRGRVARHAAPYAAESDAAVGQLQSRQPKSSRQGPEPRLGGGFGEALSFALDRHRNQARKGTTIPYIAHLLQVCGLVLEAGGDEDQAIAALLHDAIEDAPAGEAGRVRREIRGRFGGRVLRIVEACTDADVQPKPPWRQRKETYLHHARDLEDDALLVASADKLHNARAILRDLRDRGDWS